MKIHARDVEQMFKDNGAERASLELFIIIIEHLYVINEELNEITQVCNKLIDMLGTTASGYSELRRQLERVKSKRQDDDLPDNI